MAKRPTISDVARASGVSKTTVSKVMNVPIERIDVPEVTRLRVLKASQDLGYQPSWRARAFARGKTHSIGLVHCDTMPMFASDLWQRMVSRLMIVLHDHGYDAQFVPAVGNGERWREILIDQRLDGCVVFHEMLPQVAEVLLGAYLPTVMLNAVDPRFSSVIPDDRQGARLLAEHLISLGHRRIAFVDTTLNARHFSNRERRAGFRDAMTNAGLADGAAIIEGDPEAVVQKVIEARPRVTALITYSDSTMLQVSHGLWRRGLRVPEDLSVATFNDVATTQLSNPPVTTMAVPADEIGAQAAGLLLKQIERGSTAAVEPPKQVMLPETLIVRESSGPPSDRKS